MRGVILLAASVLALGVGDGGAGAAAQAPSASDSSPASPGAVAPATRGLQRVEVVVIGTVAQYRLVRAALRLPLAQIESPSPSGPKADLQAVFRRAELLDAREIVDPPRQAASALARIWIDTRGTIYLVDGGWERVLIRRLGAGDQLDALALERIVQIVQFAVEALLAGRLVGVPRLEARRQLRLPKRSAPAKTLGLQLGLRSAIRFWSADAPPIWGLGMSLGVAIPRRRWLAGVQLQALLLLPHQLEPTPVTARLWGGQLRLLADLRYLLSTRWHLGFGLGGGLDLLSVEPRSSADPQLRLAGDVLSTSAVLTSQLQLGWRPATTVEVGLTLGAELDLADHEFVIEQANGAARQPLLDPWRIWPVVGIEVVYLWR